MEQSLSIKRRGRKESAWNPGSSIAASVVSRVGGRFEAKVHHNDGEDADHEGTQVICSYGGLIKLVLVMNFLFEKNFS